MGEKEKSLTDWMQTYLNYETHQPDPEKIELERASKLQRRIESGGGDYRGLVVIDVDGIHVHLSGAEWTEYILPSLRLLISHRQKFSNEALKIIKEKISEKINTNS